MVTTITKRKNGQIEESLDTIKTRLKRNLAEMERLILGLTTNLRIAIGRDLIKARKIVDRKGEQGWYEWLGENFSMSRSSADKFISFAKSKAIDRTHSTTITEHLRIKNPNYAMPRQSVDEKPIRNILAGIDSKVLLDREASEKKEGRLKKLVALELVDAGFRALSVKVHSDKGGSDDAMRRLDEVRKTLKRAIKDDEISF